MHASTTPSAVSNENLPALFVELAHAPRLTVVVPCFNEEAVLAELVRRVVAACECVAPGSYEIVIVNDGSRDRTASIISEMNARNRAVVGVDLARRYGHQIALTAGLSFARGERVLIIDADLQDPPELLGEMMSAMDRGANVVYGRRVNRANETRFKVRSAHLFYRLLDRIADIDIPVDTGDFRLMDRRAVDAILSMPEQHRFIRGMIAWVGLSQVELPYERAPRHAGTTKYPLRRMLALAADAITSFSTAPLRLSFYLAAAFFVAALGLGAYGLAGRTLSQLAHGGLGVLLMFLVFSAAQLACLGIIGEYLGRTHMQVKNRPLFIVKEIFARRDPPARGAPPKP
jgi:polyisoprenyl-phosphate glycosyltransferase